mgnify:CR=1 FL=1
MTNLKELKTTRLEFRRIASNMLRTEYTNQDVPLHRFKNYIDTNDTIKYSAICDRKHRLRL